MQKIEYVYVKPRSAFGKQCFFEESGPTVVENIPPDPRLAADYIYRDYVHKEVQRSEQYALHEAQTTVVPLKNSGMLHSEGGWPKEINPRDEEVTARFRRRVEKEDRWVEKMKPLLETMDMYISQNNAVNIYVYHFDDMIPTSLTLAYDVRTLNVYTDPHFHARPVRKLSWSPDGGDRLAGAYSFTEFQESLPNISPDSYIWDIENPNKALITLKPTSPAMSLEFNPRDPWMLISGLLSGQVCNWDTRIGDGPVQISHRQFSHRSPATQTLWIASKTNSEFFSASTDGTIKWWDIRNLRHPKDVIVMDLDDPQRADIVKAIGVSALQFESTMGSKFMAGTVNGVVISGNRKGNTPLERIALRFSGHTSPVLAIDRNPFNTKNFLTVGDWTVKIWAEDTREGSLLTTGNEDSSLSGGCWSRSRFSVFFTVNTKGVLEIYDMMRGIDQPVISYHVCDDILTAIRPHEDGHLLAIGSQQGCIYLVECSDGLTISSDKIAVANYFEVCSRYAKATDSRLKEMRVLKVPSQYQYRPSVDFELGDVRKGRERKKSVDKEKAKFKLNEAAGKEKDTKKKSKAKKPKESTVVAEDPRLAETEKEFFATIEAETERYSGMEGLDKEQVTELMQEIGARRRRSSVARREAANTEKTKRTEERTRKRREKMKKSSSKTSVRRSSATRSEKEESKVELDLVEMPEKKRKRSERAVKICKMDVCKPEICCKDAVAEAKERTASKSSTVKLKDACSSLPHGGIILTKDVIPDILADEVKEAKKQLRQWQKEIIAGKRTFRLSGDTADVPLVRRTRSSSVQPTRSSSIGIRTSIRDRVSSRQAPAEKEEAKDKETVQWAKRAEISKDEKTTSGGKSKPVRRRRRSQKMSKAGSVPSIDRPPMIDWSEPTIRKILSRGSVQYPRISAAYVRGIDETSERRMQNLRPKSLERA